MAAEFNHDDKRYLRWLDSIQNGFVLNTEPTPNKKCLKLHKASCSQLKRNDMRQRAKTVLYQKVCATTISEIQQWVDKEFGTHVPMQPCGHCRPKG